MAKLTPCLWFEHDAEAAANFYVSLFADSRVTRVMRSPAATPAGEEGSVIVVEFTLLGQPHMALNGGTALPTSNRLSLSVDCADQAEVDRLWEALGDGGTPQACGWINDRWGHPWQIVPNALPRLLADPDPDRARRAMQAMMTMVKIDIAALEAAADGG